MQAVENRTPSKNNASLVKKRKEKEVHSNEVNSLNAQTLVKRLDVSLVQNNKDQ